MYKFADICGGRFFLIPDNQRGFSWGARQVDDVIADLKLADTQSHYMGPLIVNRTKSPDFQDDELNTTAEFILEDGQQRLTTLFIFANEIRRHMVARGIHAVHSQQLESYVHLKHKGQKLRLQNEQQVLQNYLSYILTGSPAPPAERVPAMEALDQVQRHIDSFVSRLGDQELLVWKQRVCNQALFVWVDLATAGVNRYLTFDAINSRGLPLSEFDKIKNFCMLLCNIRGLTIDVAASWYKALSQLERFGTSSRTHEADFIAELYSSYHNKTVSHRDVHSAFVDKYRSLLTSGDAALEADLLHFINLWEPYAKSFGFVSSKKRSTHYGTMCSVGAGSWLDRLDNMDLPTISRPLLVAAHLKYDPDGFCTTAHLCETYTFRVHAVIRKRKDANATKIIELANEILRGGKEVGHVFQKICAWLKVHAPLSKVIAELADGRPKYAFDPNVPGWLYCYYFLYEYEISVSPAGVAPLPYGTSKEVVKNQQEHILPQQHRDQGWWESNWPDASKADKYKHRLGNLVLTTNNNELARKPLPEKLSSPAPTYCYKHPNATNSEKRIQNFTDGQSWEAKNILVREVEMLEFAAKRWSVGCVADEQEVQLPDDYAEALEKARCVIRCESEPLVKGGEAGSEEERDDFEFDNANDDLRI